MCSGWLDLEKLKQGRSNANIRGHRVTLVRDSYYIKRQCWFGFTFINQSPSFLIHLSYIQKREMENYDWIQPSGAGGAEML